MTLVTLDPLISVTLRMLLVVLFGAAATHKIVNLRAFMLTLHKYVQGSRLFGQESVRDAVGVLVIMAELALAAASALPDAILAGYAAAAVLVTYAAAMYFNLRRGNTLLDCGCSWSGDRQPVTPTLIGRNLCLAVLALATTLPVGRRALTSIDILSVVAAVVAAAVLYSGLNRLLALVAGHQEAG